MLGNYLFCPFNGDLILRDSHNIHATSSARALMRLRRRDAQQANVENTVYHRRAKTMQQAPSHGCKGPVGPKNHEAQLERDVLESDYQVQRQHTQLYTSATPLYTVVVSVFFSIIPIYPLYTVVVSSVSSVIRIYPLYRIVVFMSFSVITI